MATCNCGCEDCSCNTPQDNILQYSTIEINQRLFDSIINASVRYACPNCGIKQLTLAEVLPLVPDKDRTLLRIVTFLNKDANPVPEIWQFFGRTILDWTNISYWVQIPTTASYQDIYLKVSNLEKSLSDEAINRVNADNSLQNQINEIKGDPNTSIPAINERINQEISDRQTADSQLRQYFVQLILDASSTYAEKLKAEIEERRKEDDRLEQLIKNITIDPSKSYIQSTTVVSMEVVDKAPSVENNTLYFEYEDMPEYSTYSLKISPENNIVANVEATIPVELSTYLIGNNGYSKVQVQFELTQKPENASMIGYILEEGTGTRYDFTDSGSYPTEPIELPANYEKAIQVTATFNMAGNYSLNAKLVNTEDSSVITEVDVPFTVNEQ